MTSLFAARRAAEEFAELVDAPADTTSRRAGPDTDLLATVALLRAQTDVSPRAEFVADLRARLLVAADTALAPAATTSVRGAGDRTSTTTLPVRTSRRIGTAAAAALVVIGGTTGLAAAAQGSLPGDSLYPVKRGIENAVTALNTGKSGKGADLLAEATTRLDEAQALDSRDAPGSRISGAVADFEDSANRGADLLFTAYQLDGDAADIATVRQFTRSSRGDLDALSLTAPASAQPALRSAEQSLDEIERQAVTLCAACGADGSAADLSARAAAATFRMLVTEPVRRVDARDAAAAAAALRAEQSKLAKAAEAASRTTPSGEESAPAPTTGSTDTPQTDVPAPTTVTSTVRQQTREALSAVTAPVKSTLDGSTDGVTGLIREVTGATPLAPVTDPLVDGLDKTIEGVTGLLP